MQLNERLHSRKVDGEANETLVDIPSGSELRQQIEADLEQLNQLNPDEAMPQILSVLLNWRRKILLTPKQ